VNWRATVLGAIVVVIAGAATGAAIGGKSETEVRTQTVDQTVTVTTTAKQAPTQETTTGETEGKSEQPKAPPPQHELFLSEYLQTQGGAEVLDRNAEDVSLSSSAEREELAGQTYQNAVAFTIDGQSEFLKASYQIPTPGFTRFTVPSAGLKTTSNAKAAYQLTIYKNEDSAPSATVLYRASFRGPSTVRKIDFALQGATDVLLVWTHKTPEPESEDTFILAEPVLSH
jgi:hypothetical protein